jgi:hypothetical protein
MAARDATAAATLLFRLPTDEGTDADKPTGSAEADGRSDVGGAEPAGAGGGVE